MVGNASLVHSLRDKELPAIALQLANVKEVAKHDGAPRDTDTLFHSRLTALEVATNDLQAALKLLNGGLEGGWTGRWGLALWDTPGLGDES